MYRIAEFEKVSFERFCEVWESVRGKTDADTLIRAFEALSLPVRATSGSAGYDFYLPFDLVLHPGESVRIPTGIRARMEEEKTSRKT